MADFVDERVKAAVDLNDLLPILKHLSFEAVKEFVTQQIAKESDDTLRAIQYREFSINDVLPSDVIQHILSFDGLYHPRTTNKKWESLSVKNEYIKMKKMYTLADAVHTNTNSISTWIVHPKRRHLNVFERERGYKGPMNMYDAFYNDKFNDDDRILIHDGVYELSNVIPLPLNGAEIIGLGNNITVCTDKTTIFVTGSTRWSRKPSTGSERKAEANFTNISFCCAPSHRDQGIDLFSLTGEHHKVTMRNCSFKNFEHVIDCHCPPQCPPEASSIIINECRFVNANCAVGVNGDFVIMNSLFKKCHCSVLGTELKDIRLKCIGNTFDDVGNPPIQVWQRSDARQAHEFELRDNVIKNTNGQQFDPNKVHASYYR